MAYPFSFTPVDASTLALVQGWLKLPHATEWFYGQGLENTLNHLDAFIKKTDPDFLQGYYWIAWHEERPFGFLITSTIDKPHDPLTRYCQEQGPAITLDILIGEPTYLGHGLAHPLIYAFLTSQFPLISEVLIDPESTNTKAIHVYQKVGFKILENFIPTYSPHPHYMMHLKFSELQKPKETISLTDLK